jgi:hypothetical protein
VLQNAFPGGGGQSSCATANWSNTWVGIATDTGGPRFSVDGTATSWVNTLGLLSVRAKMGDGMAASRVVTGKVFMTCGDGSAGSSQVAVADGMDSQATATKWTRLDTGTPTLIFSGGNSDGAPGDQPPAPYPRHYGTILEIDDATVAGYTFLYCATVNAGTWCIRVRNSDNVATGQWQVTGTSGTYVRSLKMATFEPNAAANIYSRLISNVYSTGTPVKPVLTVISGLAATGTPTFTTSTITAAPTNVENISYIKSTTASSVGTAMFVKNGGVYVSTNAFTAAAGSITFSANLVRTAAQNDGPEDTSWWISSGTTQQGSNHVFFVGANINARGLGGGRYNQSWRGVVAATNATPGSAITWTAQPDQFSEQILGRAGAANKYWLFGTNTPGKSSGAAISAWRTVPGDPSRIYVIARGNTFISTDYGVSFVESRSWGSAAHFSLSWSWGVNPTYVATSCGDWALAAATDSPPAMSFQSSEPHAVLRIGGLNANFTMWDTLTGEAVTSISDGGTSGVPAHDATNRMAGLSPVEMTATYSSLSPAVIYQVKGTNNAAAICGVIAYNPARTQRVFIVGTYQGMFYAVNGANPTLITAAVGATNPYATSGGFDGGVAMWDGTRNVAYFMDRDAASVWRVTIQAGATVSTATRIFQRPWTWGSASQDGVGYIDLDEPNNRVWVSTKDYVGFINSASTAPNTTTESNATSVGWDTKYPGEISGPMCFIPQTGQVAVATQGYSGDSPVYPLNGATGPRFLVVSTPTTTANWATATDWAVTRDNGYRMGQQVPWGIYRNVNGTQIAITQRGGGVALWNLNSA